MLVDIGLLYNAYTNLNEKQRDTYINKIHIICKYKHIIYIYISIYIYTYIHFKACIYIYLLWAAFPPPTEDLKIHLLGVRCWGQHQPKPTEKESKFLMNQSKKLLNSEKI